MPVVITDAQVEAAARAVYAGLNNCNSVLDDPTHGMRWSAVKNQDHYRFCVRLAAPYLQALLAPPTEQEIRRLLRYAGPYLQGKHATDANLGGRLLSDFVDARNGHSGVYPAPIENLIEQDHNREDLVIFLSRRLNIDEPSMRIMLDEFLKQRADPRRKRIVDVLTHGPRMMPALAATHLAGEILAALDSET